MTYFVCWISISFDEKWPQCYTPQCIIHEYRTSIYRHLGMEYTCIWGVGSAVPVNTVVCHWLLGILFGCHGLLTYSLYSLVATGYSWYSLVTTGYSWYFFVARRHSPAPPRRRSTQYRTTFVSLSVSLWNDLDDLVFDSAGLAGFMGRIKLSCSPDLLLYFVFHCFLFFSLKLDCCMGLGSSDW